MHINYFVRPRVLGSSRLTGGLEFEFQIYGIPVYLISKHIFCFLIKIIKISEIKDEKTEKIDFLKLNFLASDTESFTKN